MMRNVLGAIALVGLLGGCSGPEVQDGAPPRPRPHVLHFMSDSAHDIYVEITSGAENFALIGRTMRDEERGKKDRYAYYYDYTLPSLLDNRTIGLLVSAQRDWCQESRVFTGTDVTIVLPLTGVPQRPFPDFGHGAPTAAPAPPMVAPN